MEELIRSGVQDRSNLITFCIRLLELLEARAGRSRTSKTWTDNLAITVINMNNFSRGGHVYRSRPSAKNCLTTAIIFGRMGPSHGQSDVNIGPLIVRFI